MIEELTKEQELLMKTVSDEYENNALSEDDSYDPEIIQSGIDFIYEVAELKTPEKIIICESPMEMAIEAELKPGETIDYLGNGYDSGWTAFCDYFQRIGIELEKDIRFDEWRDFILKSGVFATVLCENVAFVCIRPCVVKTDKNDDLHYETGPAIAWRDGYSEYYLNGVSVDEKIVMTPAEKLDGHLVLTEKNAEVRREIVRKIGIEKVCKDLKSKTLDVLENYELLNLDLGDGRSRPYLKMKNPSTGTYHLEGIEPRIKTCKEALAWRNGQEDYEAPEVLT